MKGIGGYHLACDARNATAVKALRDRKFRKEKPFALMVGSIEIARELVELSPNAESLLTSAARPIVLAPAKMQLADVSPGNDDLGVMLPYTPLHHLLFAAGAPEVLVMTSANRSSEPIAYQDEEAAQQLAGIADAFLIGERPIARRVDDSIARAGTFGPVILRRSRGYAPSAVTTIPISKPILATGADLKNTITLVVNGQAFVSQHIGDLDQYECLQAFRETIDDLMSMYEVPRQELIVAHDAHPQYLSSATRARAAGRCLVRRSSTIARTSLRFWPSAARGTSECWASASTEPATETTEPFGAANSSPEAFSKASNAWRTCGRRRFPAATPRRAIPSRPPPDSWPRSTACRISARSRSDFPSAIENSLELIRRGVADFHDHFGGPALRRGCGFARASRAK